MGSGEGTVGRNSHGRMKQSKRAYKRPSVGVNRKFICDQFLCENSLKIHTREIVSRTFSVVTPSSSSTIHLAEKLRVWLPPENRFGYVNAPVNPY